MLFSWEQGFPRLVHFILRKVELNFDTMTNDIYWNVWSKKLPEFCNSFVIPVVERLKKNFQKNSYCIINFEQVDPKC